MNNKLKIETSYMLLHIIAMIFMLFDHLWGTIIPGNNWLTCLGRISFPIFAFLIVEGYFHTKSIKKYVYRLLIFAILSEIPFNLIMGSRIFYPIHQNVLFSFLISIGLICLNEKAKLTNKIWLQLFTGFITIMLGYIVGIISMVDFYHAGILTVLVFYFFRQRKLWSYIGQFFCLLYINTEILGGLVYEINIFGKTYFWAQQGFAILALIPIWLYKGKQGYHNKTIQYFYYLFYPLHLLLLFIIKNFI